MHPRLAHVLLALAASVLVTGGIVRPCDCAGDADAVCHGFPRSLEREAPAPAPTCCCCAHEREDASKPMPADDDEGCTLCCKPRPAYASAEADVALEAPAASTLALADAPAPFHAVDAASWRPDREAWRRTIDPWLLSPEGLAVFLI